MPFTRLALVAALCAVLFGCASPPAGGTFSSNSPYNTVFQACRAAAADVGFGVTSADPKSGFISASQAVFSGQGTTVTLSVSVRRAGGHVEVDADFVRPPGTVSLGGNFSDLFLHYMDAVKKRVPDLTVTFTKG